jgi:hypothetical protein
MMDILICAAPKDYNKLPYVVQSICQNLKDEFGNIFVIAPSKFYWGDDDSFQMPGISGYPPIYHFTDAYLEEKLEFKKTELKERPNWTSQQFFKLFQDITPNDEYLIVDCDLMFTNPVNIYENGRPQFYLGIDQNHQPYFNFQEKMLGFGKVHYKSFICEFFLIRKRIINDMLNSLGMTRQQFIRKSIELLNSDPSCHIGEPELYGSYVTRYFPNEYGFKELKTKLLGKQQALWYPQEILQAYALGNQSGLDTVTIHTWNSKL